MQLSPSFHASIRFRPKLFNRSSIACYAIILHVQLQRIKRCGRSMAFTAHRFVNLVGLCVGFDKQQPQTQA